MSHGKLGPGTRYRRSSKSSLRRFPCPVCSSPSTSTTSRGGRVLQQAVRHRARQDPPRLRQFRHRRAAAETGPAGEPGQGGSLNHLGIEVPDTDTVDAVQARLTGTGLDSVHKRERPAAMPGRTSSGSRACRTGRPGRSTRSWATARPSTTTTTAALNAATPTRAGRGSPLSPRRSAASRAGVSLHPGPAPQAPERRRRGLARRGSQRPGRTAARTCAPGRRARASSRPRCRAAQNR